jgi:hypothetical protein
MSGPIDWPTTAFWALVLLGGAWLLLRGIRQMRTTETERAHRYEQQTERLREAGALLSDGSLKCIVCERAPAARRWLVTRKSELDRDWLGHRKLHHHLPMYVIVESPDATYQACESCRRLAEGKLEEVLGEGRAAAAKLRSDVERDLAHWENGGLLHWAQAETAKSYRGRYPMAQQHALLPAETTPVHHSGSVTLAPASTDEPGNES